MGEEDKKEFNINLFEQKLTEYLDTASQVEKSLVDFQRKQGRMPGEGIILADLNPEERKSFWELNSELLDRHHSLPINDLSKRDILSESGGDEFNEAHHDFYRPNSAYFSDILYLETSLKKGDKYENEFRQSTTPRAPLSDPIFIRHMMRVWRSFGGEVLGKPEKKEFNIIIPLTDVVNIFKANSVTGIFGDLPQNAIDIRFDVTKPIMLFGREDDLYRVFYNILRNAEKILGRNFSATNKQGVIDIKAEENEELQRVTVDIADNGPGIDADAVLSSAIKAGVTTKETGEKMTEEEKLQLIFLPGVTGFAEIGIRDTGKGLSICRRIVEEHQGRIRIDSKTGVGTKLIIDLPKK